MDIQNDSFTKFTNNLFDLILVLPLKKNQIKVMLLILRLTVGCQQKWAKFNKAALQIVGIGPTHAKDVIEELQNINLIVINTNTKEYALNYDYLFSISDEKQVTRTERLKKTIGIQLFRKRYQKSKDEITKTVSEVLPIEEGYPYQKSNILSLSSKDSTSGNKQDFFALKDILNKRINSNKES